MQGCNKNCLECMFEDCIETRTDELDIYKSHLLDKELAESNVDKDSRTYKYNHSKKRKETSKRYLSTDKGKETRKRSCDNYAKNHPDRVRAKSRLYYERHKDEIKARRLAKQKKQNDIFECSEDKCLTCPLEKCLYDGYRESKVIIDGVVHTVVRKE